MELENMETDILRPKANSCAILNSEYWEGNKSLSDVKLLIKIFLYCSIILNDMPSKNVFCV